MKKNREQIYHAEFIELVQIIAGTFVNIDIENPSHKPRPSPREHEGLYHRKYAVQKINIEL